MQPDRNRLYTPETEQALKKMFGPAKAKVLFNVMLASPENAKPENKPEK